MKPTKYSFSDTRKIDLQTKIIYKYPTPTRTFDIGKMVVKGRHPQGDTNFIIESDCQFLMYILKGQGKVFVGDQVFDVVEQDVVFVPTNHKFAVEGEFEYITIDVPAFYPEQSELVSS